MAIAISPYADASREEVLSLWARALPLDSVTEDVFESRVLLDENFDPSTFLLARENGSLAGFVIGTFANRMPLGDADPTGTRSWITIFATDPWSDLERTGSALLTALETRFRELGKREVFVSGYPPGYFTPGVDKTANAELLTFLGKHGYRPYHESLSMDAPIVKFKLSAQTREKEEALRREGIEIRAYRRTDLVRFLDFLERSMPSDWVRVERRNLRKLTEGGFHCEQVTLVVRGDEIIGYCQFEGSHFGPFGVADAYQGRGIGTVLLGKTIERMRQEGHHDAWVMWTDDAAAKVYGKFGFRETRRFVQLKKEL